MTFYCASVFINGSQNHQNVDYDQSLGLGEVKKKIDVTAPRGALGVTSMRRLSSTSGVLEEYFSSTSLNIFCSQ